MNYVKRAVISILRRLGKSLILFALVLILGTIVSGAISIRQAVQSTEVSLMSRLPTIATTFWDHSQAAFMTSDADFPLTTEIIREVVALPYVKSYDFSMWVRLYGRGISAYADQNPPEEWGIAPEERVFIASLSHFFNVHGLEELIVEGVNNPKPVAFQEGVLNLIKGRTFTVEEIENGSPVVLISDRFAAHNNLTLGSILHLESMLFDQPSANWNLDFWQQRPLAEILDNLYATKDFEMEVIGIFEISRQINLLEGDGYQWTNYKLNQIYAPLALTEAAHEFLVNANQEFFPTEETFTFMNQHFEPNFILYDPRDLAAFTTAANEMLPGAWSIEDLSASFDGVLAAMATMGWLADQILFVGVGSTIVILSLLITLFLRDRQLEIGIYLSLGEKRLPIMAQLLIEVLIVAMIAVTLSMIVGNLMANYLSRTLLEQHLIENKPYTMHGLPFNLAWHHPTTQELMLLYDTSLNAMTIVILYSVSTIVILVSTAIPMFYIMSLNPKKILLPNG